MNNDYLRAALLALVLAPGVAVAADDDSWADVGIRGEFRRTGNEFDCRLILSERFSPGDYVNITTDQPCLFFGPVDAAIAIGSLAKPLLTSLGPPIATQPDAGGSTSHFFRFGEGKDPPFFVVSVMQERIAALQVSGPANTTGLDNLSFAGIHIGSSEEQLLKRFGAPLRKPKGGLPNSEMWSYLPWPFSFEVADGKVISVRISNLALR